MSEYWKAVRPDGTDFYSGTVQWIPEDGVPEGGHVVAHRDDGERLIPGDPSTHLSVATIPTNCTGMKWPCRLLRVVPDGREVLRDPDLPHKRCSARWRVIEEVDAHLALGPQGAEVAALVERAYRLTSDEVAGLAAPRITAWTVAREVARIVARIVARDGAVARATARTTAWDAAGGGARIAATAAARHAARRAAQDAVLTTYWRFAKKDAPGGAAADAALATLSRDLISTENHDLLMAPWREVVGDA